MPRSVAISVVIPVFNQANFIPDAIASVINQDWTPLELIIVNDGSTDDLEDKLAQLHFPFRYIKQENQGPAAARNRGIECSLGEYLSFLDADDVWPANRLRTLFHYAESQNAEIVLGRVLEPDGNSLVLPSFGASVIDKKVFERTGLLDESLRYSEDQNWFLKAKEEHIRLITIPEIALCRRAHAQSLTYQKSWNEVGIHKVLKMSLDRRRRSYPGPLPKLSPLSTYRVTP